MKLQFGLFYRDERTANTQDLAALLGSYQAWNAETSGHVFHGPLLMAYRGDRITWEEDTETQPLLLGPYALSFDGRLDNREDVAAKAGLTKARSIPDPVLIAEAYAKHGDSILPTLIGEFALVMWRLDTHSLTFCRSVDGARPLYYLLEDQRLLWSSDIAHLLQFSKIGPKINDRYIWEYFLGFPGSELTPFSEIGAVEAGTVLRFVKGSFSPVVRLWDPRNIEPLTHRSDAEYEEQFRFELRQAVRSRLRAKGTVFCELSGGLDSSSLVLTAHDILRQDNRDPKCLQTLSMVYDKSRSTDERYFIREVERQRGVNSIYVAEDDIRFTASPNEVTFTGFPNIYQLRPGKYPTYAKHMQKHDAMILLTGHGGDSMFWSTPRPEILIADLLYKGQLVCALQSCTLSSRYSGIPYATLLLRKSIPLAVRCRLRLPLQYTLAELPSWLCLKGHRDVVEKKLVIKPAASMTPSHNLRIWITESLFRSISIANANADRHLYISHPYSHRPLIEFCIAVPMSQMQRKGETRSLQRRALAEMLPAKIVMRKGKALLEEPYSRAVQRDWSRLGDVDKWQICTNGYVRPRELNNALHDMRIGLFSSSSNCVPIAIALEGFLRSLSLLREGSRSALF